MKRRREFAIVYEDPGLLAVNKAAGIAVGADRWDGSKDRLDRLLEAFLEDPPGEGELSAKGGLPPRRRLFTVHRIDRDTSGLVIFARDEENHRRLSRAFEDRLVEKRYLAVILGRPGWMETVCDLPLVIDGDKQHRTIIDRYRGKNSLTRFRLLGSAGNYSVLEVLPETGRTHQIRVHLASLGHPLACDPLYGDTQAVFLSSFKRSWRGDPLEERPLLSRLALHAAGIFLPGFPGPAGEGLRLEAPLPRDMAALIRQMEKQAGREFGTGTAEEGER